MWLLQHRIANYDPRIAGLELPEFPQREAHSRWGVILKPQPPHTRQKYEQTMAAKLSSLPCFEAFGVIFSPDFCSCFCLVCGGGGSLARSKVESRKIDSEWTIRITSHQSSKLLCSDHGITQFESHHSEWPDFRFRVTDSVPLGLSGAYKFSEVRCNEHGVI